MFHVFPGVSLDFSRNSSKLEAPYTGGDDRDLSKSQRLFGGELGMFPSPRAFIQEESCILRLAPRLNE